MKSVPDEWEEKQGNRIQHEHGPERDGHLFFFRVYDRPNGGNRTPSTDGGARADQERRNVLHLEQATNSETEEHGKAYAERGVEESGPTRPHDLVKIHYKAQSNDGCLQEERGELLSVEVIRVRERHAVDQPGQQCQRGRNEATSIADKADE